MFVALYIGVGSPAGGGVGGIEGEGSEENG